LKDRIAPGLPHAPGWALFGCGYRCVVVIKAVGRPSDCVQHAGIANALGLSGLALMGEHSDLGPVDAGGRGPPGLAVAFTTDTGLRVLTSCALYQPAAPTPIVGKSRALVGAGG
jgi:hypothetical protein